MVFIGILLILLGLAFAALGYLIAFRRKYALINNFVDDKHRGKFDQSYAVRTGLIEIFWGILSVLFGILVLAIHTTAFTWTAFLLIVLGTAASLIAHTLISMKKVK